MKLNDEKTNSVLNHIPVEPCLWWTEQEALGSGHRAQARGEAYLVIQVRA